MVDTTETLKPSFAVLDAWINLALKSIETKQMNDADVYINKLRHCNFPLCFCLDAYKKYAMYGVLDFDIKNQILNYRGTEQLFYRLCMRLSDVLGLGEQQLIDLGGKIIYPVSGRGCYYKALAVKDKNPKLFEVLLQKSSELGYGPAKEYILNKAIEKNDLATLERFGNELVPLANYSLAMKIKEKQYAKAITRLKMAASCEYLPAILKLVDINYDRMLKARRNPAIAAKLLPVILYVLEKVNDPKYIEWTATIYEILGDGNRAVTFLKRAGTKDSYYRLGSWYKNGINVSRDYNQAKKYYQKAKELGHLNAYHQLNEVDSLISQEAYYNRVQQQRDYSPVSDRAEQRRKAKRSSGGGGGCFITTATCKYLKKGDDCKELNAMRAYRDSVSNKSPEVAYLIDEYYRIAPLMVEKIDNRADAADIYANLWENFISKTYSFIEEGNAMLATKTYISMVLWLSEMLEVEIDIKAQEIAKKLLQH